MTEREIDVLDFIYERMKCKHSEDENLDYMMALESIILRERKRIEHEEWCLKDLQAL